MTCGWRLVKVLFVLKFLKNLLRVLKEKATTRELREELDVPRLCGTGRVGYMSGKRLQVTPQIVLEHKDHEFVWQIVYAHPSAHTKFRHKCSGISWGVPV